MSKYYFNKKDTKKIDRAETNLLTFVSTIMGSKRYKEDNDERSGELIKRLSETILELNNIISEIGFNNSSYDVKEWEQIDRFGNLKIDKEIRSEYI